MPLSAPRLPTPQGWGSRPPDRLSDGYGSRTGGGASGFTPAELGLVHYQPGPLVITLRAQIRIKCGALDGENSPSHICKKSGRGEPLLCQLEREGEAARKERSCDNSRKLCFSFSLPAPRAPRENGWIPQERRLARGLSKATCPPRPADVLKRFSNVRAPKLSNAPAGEHPQAETEGGSSSEAAPA